MHSDQYEFRGGAVTTGFRLLTETTTDGDRVTRERDQRERDQAESARRQTDLFAEPGE